MQGRRNSRLAIFALTAAVVAIAVAASAVSGAFGRPSSASSGSPRAGVVVVDTRLLGGGVAAGTGVVLTSSGKVLTNNHVIRGATTIRVTVPSTHRTYTATVDGYSLSKDVALITLRNAHGLQTVSVGSAASVRVGDSVTAIGNAGGTGVLSTKKGKVLALGRSITVSDDAGGSNRLSGLIETSAPLRPGDSGGPLLSNGKVVGIDAAASRDFVFRGSGDAFAIPVDTAVSIAKLVNTRKASSTVHVGPTAFLGVVLGQSGSSGGSVGAMVDDVASGSPADRAGLSSGDLIVTFAGHRVTSPNRLRSLVLAQSPGQSVKVAWVDQFTGSNSARVRLVAGPPQ